MLGIAVIAALVAVAVSGRERVTAALLASGKKLRLLVERATVAIAMFHADLRYVAVSQRYIEDYNLRETEHP